MPAHDHVVDPTLPTWTIHPIDEFWSFALVPIPATLNPDHIVPLAFAVAGALCSLPREPSEVIIWSQGSMTDGRRGRGDDIAITLASIEAGDLVKIVASGARREEKLRRSMVELSGLLW